MPRLRVLCLALLSLFSACGRERPVRLAVAVPLTGDMGGEGEGVRRAVELAVAEANASGRLPFRVEVEPFDDRADPAEAVNVANLIISDPKIVAVIGPYNSGCALAAARVYSAAPVAVISPSATAPDVTLQQTRPDWQGARVVFRMVPDDDVQGEYAAVYAGGTLRKKRIALVHDGTPYGAGLVQRFRRSFTARGGAVTAEERVSPGQRDFRAVVERLAASKAEAVYFGGMYTEAGLLLRQLRESPLKNAVFFGGDGVRTPALFDVAGDAAEGAYVTLLGPSLEHLPQGKGFMESYARRFPEDSLGPYDHVAYAAARIVLDAMFEVGPDRAKIVEAIRGRRHSGLLGETAFDAKGDTRSRAVRVLRARVKDRSFVAS